MTNLKLAVSASVIRYLRTRCAQGRWRNTDDRRCAISQHQKPSAHTMLNNLKTPRS